MMCDAVEPLLSPYRDGELPPDVMRQIDAHVTSCADCRGVLDSYEMLASTLVNWAQTVELPPSFETAVVLQLEQRDNAHVARRMKVGSLVTTVAMVAALFALAVTPVGHIAWLVFRLLGSGSRSAYLSIGQVGVPNWFSGSVMVVALTCMGIVIVSVASLVYIQRRWSAADHELGGFR